MARPLYRSAYATALALAGLALSSGAAHADTPADPEVQASMQCDRANEPGRVRCTVEARVDARRTIAWADVEILSLPDFASALKGRIGPQDALSRDAASTKWALGLVAKRAGQGEVRARVRLVACELTRSEPGPSPSPPRCAPISIDVKATITVGG